MCSKPRDSFRKLSFKLAVNESSLKSHSFFVSFVRSDFQRITEEFSLHIECFSSPFIHSFVHSVIVSFMQPEKVPWLRKHPLLIKFKYLGGKSIEKLLKAEVKWNFQYSILTAPYNYRKLYENEVNDEN